MATTLHLNDPTTGKAVTVTLGEQNGPRLDILNKIQRLLIDFANEQGIILQDEFGSVDKFKKFVIGFTIRSLTELGADIKDAFDFVMGDNAYQKMAETIWNDLRNGK